MTRRRLLVGFAAALLAAVGLWLWLSSVFTGENVRRAVAAQLERALGQPVQVGGVRAGLFPRVTIRLDEVRIGEPVRITINQLDLATDLRALFSRRVEHATADLSGVRIELPFPRFTFAGMSPATGASRPPVELVSIDHILLSDVHILSGGRTLDVEATLTPAGAGATIDSLAVTIGDTSLEATGRIVDLAGPTVELQMDAGTLDFTTLLPFIGDFARGATGTAASGTLDDAPRAGSAWPDLLVRADIRATRGLLGQLALDQMTARAEVTAESVRLDPLRFAVFGGAFEGPLTLSLGRNPAFRVHGAVSDVDVAALMAFAGTPGLITGHLDGRLALNGRGVAAADVLSTADGTARVDVRDGSVKGLGLVRSVIVATSMRTGARADFTKAGEREPFSAMGATLRLARGGAATDDLRFVSDDVLWSAAGTIRLDGSAVDLEGPLQLSDALSKEAGRDLLRYTAKDGRVTFPAHVTGPASNLQARIDVGAALKRAITNRAIEEAKEAIGGLLRRR